MNTSNADLKVYEKLGREEAEHAYRNNRDLYHCVDLFRTGETSDADRKLFIQFGRENAARSYRIDRDLINVLPSVAEEGDVSAFQQNKLAVPHKGGKTNNGDTP